MADTNTAPAETLPKAEKAPKAPINPQVPDLYKTERGTYKPGHDARHASDVAKQIAADPSKTDALLKTLGSDNLRAKAVKQADNIVARLGTTGTEGEVKVGKEVYDARKVRGSGVVRYDGPKGWTEVEADSKIATSFRSRKEIDAEVAKANEAADSGE